jgi:predicted AAA+ superfamily ATPase
MKTPLIQRPLYMEFLTAWKNEDVIKVVSGVRRCGKSTLFEMFRNQLTTEGVQAEQIININFEEFDYLYLCDPTVLYSYIKEKIQPGQQYYIFLDEIQNVRDFERVVNSLHLNKNLDIYITGSNAYFMSGELATFLSGRYVELKMLPLSFQEFVSTKDADKSNLKRYYNEYLQTSFPYAISLDSSKKQQYLEGIYSTVVLKDIVQRLTITDIATLENIIRYLYAEIGSLQNINKITNTMNSFGNKITHKTVARYMEGIEDSLLIYKAERYNVKGRKVFAGTAKYYAVDNGLRQFIAGDRVEDFGHILENIVYLELLRRGYQVYVGMVDNLEVDFLAIDPKGDRLYIQVAHNTENETTLTRELKPLQAIKDHYSKLLLTMDEILPEQNFDGIVKMPVLKWLLS